MVPGVPLESRKAQETPERYQEDGSSGWESGPGGSLEILIDKTIIILDMADHHGSVTHSKTSPPTQTSEAMHRIAILFHICIKTETKRPSAKKLMIKYSRLL